MDTEVTYTKTRKIKCENEHGGIGHPLVYLAIKDKYIVCPYCSKKFVLES